MNSRMKGRGAHFLPPQAMERAPVFRRQPRLLPQILAVCPSAVASVARALHVRMPLQNGADRDVIEHARVHPLSLVPCPHVRRFTLWIVFFVYGYNLILVACHSNCSWYSNCGSTSSLVRRRLPRHPCRPTPSSPSPVFLLEAST